MIEKQGDVLRSGAKERQRVREESKNGGEERNDLVVAAGCGRTKRRLDSQFPLR